MPHPRGSTHKLAKTKPIWRIWREDEVFGGEVEMMVIACLPSAYHDRLTGTASENCGPEGPDPWLEPTCVTVEQLSRTSGYGLPTVLCVQHRME